MKKFRIIFRSGLATSIMVYAKETCAIAKENEFYVIVDASSVIRFTYPVELIEYMSEDSKDVEMLGINN